MVIYIEMMSEHVVIPIPTDNILKHNLHEEMIEVFFGNIFVFDNHKKRRLNKDIKHWTCKSCNEINNRAKSIACDMRHGIGNLVDHILKVHASTWEIAVDKNRNKIEHFFESISSHATNIYGHIENVILNNKTLSSVSSITDRKYTKLDPICRETLMTYLKEVSKEIALSIKEELPKYVGKFD
jgi:hypothetical protein